MVDDCGGVAAGQQSFKLASELSGRFEATVRPQVERKWPIQGTRNVPGHRINRLDFAQITRGGAGVYHHLAGSAQLADDFGCG